MARPMLAGRHGGPLQSEVIGDNMDASRREKNGIALVRGGQYAKRPVAAKTSADWKLDTEMASAFAGITGEDGSVPSKGIYCIRDRSQHPWRVLSRRFKEAKAANAPLDQVLAPVRVLELWVRELYGEQPNRGRAA
jgi:hypothetical protein